VLHGAVLNDVTILATVNASGSDHEEAVTRLAAAPKSLLTPLVTSELDPSDWARWAQSRRWPGVKTVVRFGS
jgi:hypothetical protein